MLFVEHKKEKRKEKTMGRNGIKLLLTNLKKIKIKKKGKGFCFYE